MLPAPPPPWQPTARARMRELRRLAGPVGVARAEAEKWATGPARVIKTLGGQFWAAPLFRGWVAIDPIPAGGPIAWRFHAYGPTYRDWSSLPSAKSAASRAGYGVRAAEGNRCRFTASRQLSGNHWIAFLDALDLNDGDHSRATLTLDGELSAIVEGFLAGTTPAGVVLDYLAEHSPESTRDGFARLAARY